MTETHFGSSKNQIAHAVSLETTHANAFVAAGVEKCWSRFDYCGGEEHDVFIVISEGGYGAHIARTVYAASEDDARQNTPRKLRRPAHRGGSPMKPSRLVTFAAATSQRAVRASGAGRRLDRHMARFAFEALGT